MRRSRSATISMSVVGLFLGGVVALVGCSSDVSAGDPCDAKGEQLCSDNQEMSCGEDLKWNVAEDCGAHGTTCVVNGEGDADCE